MEREVPYIFSHVCNRSEERNSILPMVNAFKNITGTWLFSETIHQVFANMINWVQPSCAHVSSVMSDTHYVFNFDPKNPQMSGGTNTLTTVHSIHIYTRLRYLSHDFRLRKADRSTSTMTLQFWVAISKKVVYCLQTTIILSATGLKMSFHLPQTLYSKIPLSNEVSLTTKSQTPKGLKACVSTHNFSFWMTYKLPKTGSLKPLALCPVTSPVQSGVDLWELPLHILIYIATNLFATPKAFSTPPETVLT